MSAIANYAPNVVNNPAQHQAQKSHGGLGMPPSACSMSLGTELDWTRADQRTMTPEK